MDVTGKSPFCKSKYVKRSFPASAPEENRNDDRNNSSGKAGGVMNWLAGTLVSECVNRVGPNKTENGRNRQKFVKPVNSRIDLRNCTAINKKSRNKITDNVNRQDEETNIIPIDMACEKSNAPNLNDVVKDSKAEYEVGASTNKKVTEIRNTLTTTTENPNQSLPSDLYDYNVKRRSMSSCANSPKPLKKRKAGIQKGSKGKNIHDESLTGVNCLFTNPTQIENMFQGHNNTAIANSDTVQIAHLANETVDENANITFNTKRLVASPKKKGVNQYLSKKGIDNKNKQNISGKKQRNVTGHKRKTLAYFFQTKSEWPSVSQIEEFSKQLSLPKKSISQWFVRARKRMALQHGYIDDNVTQSESRQTMKKDKRGKSVQKKSAEKISLISPNSSCSSTMKSDRGNKTLNVLKIKFSTKKIAKEKSLKSNQTSKDQGFIKPHYNAIIKNNDVKRKSNKLKVKFPVSLYKRTPKKIGTINLSTCQKVTSNSDQNSKIKENEVPELNNKNQSQKSKFSTNAENCPSVPLKMPEPPKITRTCLPLFDANVSKSVQLADLDTMSSGHRIRKKYTRQGTKTQAKSSRCFKSSEKFTTQFSDKTTTVPKTHQSKEYFEKEKPISNGTMKGCSDQIQLLIKEFYSVNTMPSVHQLTQLAETIHVSYKSLEMWFSHMRRKEGVDKSLEMWFSHMRRKEGVENLSQCKNNTNLSWNKLLFVRPCYVNLKRCDSFSPKCEQELQMYYQQRCNPSPIEVKLLSKSLEMPSEYIVLWFQKQRASEKDVEILEDAPSVECMSCNIDEKTPESITVEDICCDYSKNRSNTNNYTTFDNDRLKVETMCKKSPDKSTVNAEENRSAHSVLDRLDVISDTSCDCSVASFASSVSSTPTQCQHRKSISTHTTSLATHEQKLKEVFIMNPNPSLQGMEIISQLLEIDLILLVHWFTNERKKKKI